MKIIVNADDFGKSTPVTDGIIESFKNGWIDRATLMVNMPDTDRAVRLAKEVGVGDKIGLHLNLIEGRPLTEQIMSCSNWCNLDGVFVNALKGKSLFWNQVTDEGREALRTEIVAQVEKYLSYGLPLLHCDGHQHCHRKFAILPILAPVLKEYGFKSVRRHNNLHFKVARFPHFAIRDRFDNFIVSRELARVGLLSTAYMGGFEEFVRAMKFGVTFGREESIEIMVHPCLKEGSGVINLYEKMERRMKDISVELLKVRE